MFRAIAGYFFGGATEEPQSPLETQEVNDWLVVNMADRPQDDIVMIESTRPDPMSESEYADILDAVSYLMRPVEEPELEPSDGESIVESSESEEEVDDYDEEEVDDYDEEEEDEKEEQEEEEQEEEDPKYYVKNTGLPSIYSTFSGKPFDEEYVSKFLEKLEKLKMKRPYAFKHRHMLEQEVVLHFETNPFFRATTLQPLDVCVEYNDDLTTAKVSMEIGRMPIFRMIKEGIRPDVRFPWSYQMDKVENERCQEEIKLPKRYTRMYTHIGMYSHNSGISASKTEIQRRIHELERGQKLNKYKNEKVINKGQLNRQNNNYLFQSSCKKNRRRDLQRSHSGANNNRKCNC